MKDEDKTKVQLINELVEMRQRVAELEAVDTERVRAEQAIPERRIWLPVAGMFVLLCIFAWLNEIADLPCLLLGAPRTPINWRESLIETVLIAIVGLFAVLRLIRDITERKRAEEALLRERDNLVRVFEAMEDGVYIVNQRYDIQYVNPVLVKDFGPYQSRKCYEYLHDREEVCPWCKNQDVFAGKTVRWEWYSFKNERTYDLIDTPLRNPDGSISKLEIFRDITERKRAEAAVRESEERYRSLFNGVPVGINRTTPAGQILDANPALVHMLGYPDRESLLSVNATDLYVDPEDRRRWQALIKREGVVRGFEVQLRRHDGTTIWVRSNTRAIRDADGRVLHYEGSVEDITERKRAEERLRESEMKYRNLVEKAIVGMVVTKQGKIVYCNRRESELLGYEDPSNLRGHSIAEFVHKDDLPNLIKMSKQIKSGKVMDSPTTFRGIRSDGGEVDVEAYAIQFPFEGKDAILSFHIDITERKRAEEELQHTLEKLRETLGGIIQTVALTVETKDPYTAGHQRRVGNLARAIANEMGLPQEQIDGIRMAGLIHDIGKISIPAEILSKPGRLNDFEWGMIEAHPQVSYDILKTVEFPWPVAEIVLQHHERMDGSGYPQGLSGDEIMLEARILAVADVVEAMASFRPYRPALGIDKALEEISQNRGILYDPEVVDTCLRLFTEKGFKFE